MALDPARDLPLPDTALDQLFTAARTRNAWTDRPVSDDLTVATERPLPADVRTAQPGKLYVRCAAHAECM